MQNLTPNSFDILDPKSTACSGILAYFQWQYCSATKIINHLCDLQALVFFAYFRWQYCSATKIINHLCDLQALVFFIPSRIELSLDFVSWIVGRTIKCSWPKFYWTILGRTEIRHYESLGVSGTKFLKCLTVSYLAAFCYSGLLKKWIPELFVKHTVRWSKSLQINCGVKCQRT